MSSSGAPLALAVVVGALVRETETDARLLSRLKSISSWSRSKLSKLKSSFERDVLSDDFDGEVMAPAEAGGGEVTSAAAAAAAAGAAASAGADDAFDFLAGTAGAARVGSSSSETASELSELKSNEPTLSSSESSRKSRFFLEDFFDFDVTPAVDLEVGACAGGG